MPDPTVTVSKMIAFADLFSPTSHVGKSLRKVFAPAPTPDDWRARCVVCESKLERGLWGVYSPCGNFSLYLSGWQPSGGIGSIGLDSGFWADNNVNESHARAALASASPWPGYVVPAIANPNKETPCSPSQNSPKNPSTTSVPPQSESPSVPPSVPSPPSWSTSTTSQKAEATASDRTVDAKFVSENAGEYTFSNTLQDHKFISDGKGEVSFTYKDGALRPWFDEAHHAGQGNRFRPLAPKPTGETITAGSPGDPIICRFVLEGDVLVEWEIVHQEESLRGKGQVAQYLWSGNYPAAMGHRAGNDKDLCLRGTFKKADNHFEISKMNVPTRADVLRWQAAIEKYNAEHKKPKPPTARGGKGKVPKALKAWGIFCPFSGMFSQLFCNSRKEAIRVKLSQEKVIRVLITPTKGRP